MKIGAPTEVYEGENRVSMTPDSAELLQKLGYEAVIEAGAGEAAGYSDEAYREAGVEVVADAKALWAVADIVTKVRPPDRHPGLGCHELDLMLDGRTLISFIWPAQNEQLMSQLAAKNATVLAMDTVPRISRAQKLDALSSMANIAGYRAVVEAANNYGRFFTGQVTAAGKVPPAKILIIGAGVAGLAAIGAATALGAIVRAFDTRPEVAEQIESMGAEFLMLDFEEEEDGSGEGGYAKVMSEEFIKAEMKLFATQAMDVDIIISTALIPGKPAPKLITKGMIECMRPGSVVVDLAAEQGGNCEYTVPGEKVVVHGVTIVGYADMPSRMAAQSSQLYANNLRHLLDDLTPERDGKPNVNMDDDVIRGATVIHEGKVTWPPPPPKTAAIGRPVSAGSAPPVDPEEEKRLAQAAARKAGQREFAALIAGAALILLVGAIAPASFMQHFTVFVLACFVGYQVIWNVSAALHTPLMAVTNAISGIIVVGAVLQIGSDVPAVMILAAVSVLIATINICGGFLVTKRMLAMFQRS